MSKAEPETKLSNETSTNQYNEFYLKESINNLSVPKLAKLRDSKKPFFGFEFKPVTAMVTAIFIFNVVSLVNESQMLKMLDNHSSELKSLSGKVQTLTGSYLTLQNSVNSLTVTLNERIQKEITKFKSNSTTKKLVNSIPKKTSKKQRVLKAALNKQSSNFQKEIDETRSLNVSSNAGEDEQSKRLQEIESRSIMEMNSIFEKTDSNREEKKEKVSTNGFTNTNVLYKGRAQ